MVNEKLSHFSADRSFALDAAADLHPLDAGLDLTSLRPAAAATGPLAVRALTPVADATAVLMAAIATANISKVGLAWALLTFAALLSSRTYEPRIDLRASRDAVQLAACAAVGLLAPLALAPAGLPGLSLIRLVAVGLFLLGAGRLMAYGTIRAIRAHHLVAEPTLVIGAAPLSVQLATTLADHPEFGLSPIGFIDSRRVVVSPGMPVLGDYDGLERIVQRYHVERVIIGFGRSLDLVQMVRRCQALPVRTHLIARGGDLGISPNAHHVDDVMGISLLRVRAAALSRMSRIRVKRALDMTAAFIMLALSAPLFMAAVAGVRLSSPGPVFFRQRRIGRGGKPFDLLKFRSMRVNSDSDTTWSVAHDNRVTPIGRLLRKTSIDELPQLYNVLRGDMSLIGPRPERPHFVEQFGAEVPHYHDRHRGPVGITGWSQVNKLRGNTSIHERVRMDNYYIEHWTPWLDIVIALRTVGEILRGGAA